MLRRNSILILCCILVACTSEKKLAKKCADRFPVKSETIFLPGESRYDTAYISGDTMVLQDTVRIECDSAEQVIVKYITQKKKCPDNQVITVHTTDTISISQEDTAKQVYLNAQVKILTDKNKMLWKSVLWLAGVSLVLTLWTFRGQIISIVKKIFI